MKIEPRTFTLPSGEVLTVRSLCADDAEALDAFRNATYSETHFMARYPEAYEKMFGEYGNGFEQFSWRKEITGRVISGEARLLENKETEDQGIILQLWELSDGSRMQVSVSANGNPEKLTQNGQPSPAFEYQFRYRSGFSGSFPEVTITNKIWLSG